ncbi:Glutathione transport system permease protein GsiC [Candidatus Entotheonellaceae bacterium PAL068K]
MSRYVWQRLLLFIPSLIGMSLLIFVLMRLVPGDVAHILVYESGTEYSQAAEKQVKQIRHELGLDRPLVLQYAVWVTGLVQIDFGYSYWERRPVLDILKERFPRSIELATLTFILATLFALPLGIYSAVRQNTWADHFVRAFSISGLSIPLFFSGVLILYLLVGVFQWMPPLEFTSFFEEPAENLRQLIWPAVAQAFYVSAPIMRLTRSQMLEVIREDYIRTARSKGVREGIVVYKHALRNALLPVVTFAGVLAGRLLGGQIIMENIFSIPGMGTALVAAVNFRDYPTIQALVFLIALIFLTLNFIVDMLYGWLDPRIRHA